MADLQSDNLSGPAYNAYDICPGLLQKAGVTGYLTTVDLGPVEAPMVFVQGISLGGYSSASGDGRSIPRHMAVGVSKDTTEGDPAQPSLKIAQKGMWRFRWLVAAGTRTITVNVKQAVNATPYPSVIVKANLACGVNADVTGTSAGGAGWVTIGPITVTPASNGSVWVELWNNYNLAANCPAYFDHVVVT